MIYIAFAKILPIALHNNSYNDIFGNFCFSFKIKNKPKKSIKNKQNAEISPDVFAC